jgi:predicted DsbA family dithiol-disulfide isomerase
MTDPAPRLFFDYVDPCSWIVDRRLAALEDELGVEAARHPLELAPPPNAPLNPGAPDVVERWARARAAARDDGLDVRVPPFVPWSRKAHELVLHAREQDVGRAVHDAVFRAWHEEGRDIGRVDVLVELAAESGLDRSATKAVLDVDRHLETVRTLRRVAERLGVRGVPTLLVGDREIAGIPGHDELRRVLENASDDHPSPS